MGKRSVIMTGMAMGLIWSIALVFIGESLETRPSWGDPFKVFGNALLLPGLVLAAMVARLAQRRFFDEGIIDGQPLPEGSGAATDQKVLTNTVEQLVLALCLWPIIWGELGDVAVGVLGLSFAATRILFWIGYHLSPPLRGLGFAAGFYPTLVFLGFSFLAAATR